MPQGAASSAGRHSPADPRNGNSELRATRDLHLFGQGALNSELAFEGKAASNILQHTTPSDGADFDPHVDPSGKTLVFASTRHSRYSHLYLKPTSGAAITQLTDEQANDAQPCFSPDGKRIAFTSDRAGHWDIWLVDVNGRELTQVTNSPQPELHPSWSPDGRQLVFSRVNPGSGCGELWIAVLENPGIKRLIGEGLFPAWSPTGRQIAYQKARDRGSRWFSIWTIQLQDDEAMYPTEIATSSEAAMIAPSWSTDGSQVAFAAVRPARIDRGDSPDPRITGFGRSDIGIVDADGSGLQSLTDGRAQNYSPCWAADGRIYFTAKQADTETIWSLRPFSPQPPEKPLLPPFRRAAQIPPHDES